MFCAVTLADAEKLYMQAEQEYKLENYDKSLELFEEVLNCGLYFNPPKLLLKIANCYTRKENFEQAILYYNRTLSEDKDNFHARNNLGGIYFKQGDYEKAKIEWQKSLEIKTDFAPAVTNLSRLERLLESTRS